MSATDRSTPRISGCGPRGAWQRACQLLDDLHAGGAAKASIDEVVAGSDRVGRELGNEEPPLSAIEQPIEAGFGWDAEDATTPEWRPQGITTSHDACPRGLWDGRELALVSWVRRGNADVRISFCELGQGAPRYCHVLLVEPVRRWGREAIDLRPIRVHAGGIVWRGPYLYVADTLRGLRVFAVDEMLEVETGRSDVVGHRNGRYYGGGYRYVMPQIGALRMPLMRSLIDCGPRFSFVSLASGGDGVGDSVLSGEYRRRQVGARVVDWPLFREGEEMQTGAQVRASSALRAGRANLQGVLGIADKLLLASSGGGRRGIGRLAVYQGDALIGDHPWVNGPEDLAYIPARDQVLSLTEHALGPDSKRAGRVVFAVSARGLVDGEGSETGSEAQ